MLLVGCSALNQNFITHRTTLITRSDHQAQRAKNIGGSDNRRSKCRAKERVKREQAAARVCKSFVLNQFHPNF
jgi:hypothetical protein